MIQIFEPKKTTVKTKDDVRSEVNPVQIDVKLAMEMRQDIVVLYTTLNK